MRNASLRYGITVPITVVLLALSLAEPGAAGVQRWSSRGPFGTFVWDLVIDPQTPTRLLAVTPKGVFRSTDGADSWTPVGLQLPNLCSLVSAPGAFFLTTRTELWRSLDAGATWTSSPLPTAESSPCQFRLQAVDPLAADVLYAVDRDQGVFHSMDGGANWTILEDGFGEGLDYDLLVLDPAAPTRLFVSVRGDHPGRSPALFRSTDGGDTWQEVTGGLAAGGRAVGALATDPVSTSIVYAAVDGTGLFRSTDGGDTWQSLQPSPVEDYVDVQTLIVDPSAPATLYMTAGDYGILRSDDGAASWTPVDVGLAAVRASDLVLSPGDPPKLYAETQLGVARSTDGGASWSLATAGFPAVATLGVAVGPQDPAWLYAGTGPYDVLRSPDGGASWEWNSVLHSASLDQFPIYHVIVHPRDSSIVLAAGDNLRMGGRIYRSTDAGRTWDATLGVGRFNAILALAIDPAAPRFVYATDFFGVYRSSDHGATWKALGAGGLEEPLDHLLVDPATRDLYATTESAVYRSTDRGVSWFDVSNGLPGRPLLSLAVDPTDPDVLYAGTSDAGLYRTDDRGASWTPTALDPAFAVTDLEIDPTNPAIVYAGTASGVFRTTDRGTSWRPLERSSLPDRGIRDLALDPSNPKRLYAATGSGIFEIEIIDTETVLALREGRFEVEVAWRDFQDGAGTGTVAVVPSETAGATDLRSRDSAVLEFFSAGNWELLLKVLDGTTINGYFWVFFAAATDVGFTTTVTDTSCGDVRVYDNPLGLAAPAVTDEEAFAGCDSPAPPSCVEDAATLCLGEGGRFRVEIAWTDFSGGSGAGRQARIPEPGLARSADSGLFYFFSDNNWELLIKVLDGCELNGHYWVFGAATTDVGYTLTVTDTLTGNRRVYTNPLRTSAPAITDVRGFATCDASR